MITRKAFGGAYDVMGSKHLGADVNLDWPSAQIAVVGANGAANLVHRRQLAAMTVDPDGREVRRSELVGEYEDALVNPYIAAERGYVDAVIRPSETRAYVSKAFRILRTKRESLPAKKHGNTPL